MILICPECGARYEILDSAIGPAGRKVRCASCKHQWFEGGDNGKEGGEAAQTDNSAPTAAAEEETPIPDSIKPTSKETKSGETLETVPVSQPLSKDAPPEGEVATAALPARLGGYGAALFVFLCVLGLLTLGRQSVVSLYPPAAMFLGGSANAGAGAGAFHVVEIENLALDQIKITPTHDGGLDVHGKIINIGETVLNIPRLLASFQMNDGSQGAQWIIEIPHETIDGESSIDFSASYPHPPEDATGVSLSFVTPAT